MKCPISWLKELVPYEDSVEGLADRLTFSGVEVEGIDTVGSAFDGIVVGELREVRPHPNADRLTCCTVFDGLEEWPVVCGAPNVRVGMKSPLARVGAVLGENFKIKKAKIRGEVSMGMLCAEDELGLSDDHGGIIELEDSWEPGTPLVEVYGPPETVLDLEITPNRPDCLSMTGLAREVSALYGVPYKGLDLSFTETDEEAAGVVSVSIDHDDDCPRYTARVIRDVRLDPSPDWMQRRLTHCGIRPINAVVDITNYVMLECGQPLHAFDLELLAGPSIEVRRPRAGETMATLDGVERTLTPDTLLIADAERPVALAGVMGGLGSEIRRETTQVLLESACFEPNRIRSTSRRLGLSTDSSYRFERGVDEGATDACSRRATSLLQQIAGASVCRGAIDVRSNMPPTHSLRCRWERVHRLLGYTVTPDRISELFEALDLEVTSSDDKGCTVSIPSFRGDLRREVDLIEEIARMNGLDQIPASTPTGRIVPGADDHEVQAYFALQRNLVALGLREIMNYSLVSEDLLDTVDPGDREQRERLPNPISADQSVLRTSLVPQMVESLGRNRARQIREAALFETGRVYHRIPNGHHEERRLAIGLMGPSGRSPFEKRTELSEKEQFFSLKGLVDALLAAQGLEPAVYEPAKPAWAVPGRAASVHVNGQSIGVIALVSEQIRHAWRLSEPVPVAELAIDPLLLNHQRVPAYKAVPVYPPVTRDVALVIARSVHHAELLDTIRTAAPKELESVEIFDMFQDESIGDDKKSLAYSLTYRAFDRSLTDEEANGLHDGIKKALVEKLGAELR